MGIVRLSAKAGIDEILDVLDQDAGLVIENILSKDDLSQINSELKPYLQNDIKGDNEFTGFKTKRVGALMARSPKCRELALNPLINAVSK